MNNILLVIFMAGIFSSCAIMDSMYGNGYTYIPKDNSFKVVFDGKPDVTKTVDDNLETPWGELVMNVVYYPSRFSVQAIYYVDLPDLALQHDAKTLLDTIKNARMNMIEEPKKHVKIQTLKHTTIGEYPALTAKVLVKDNSKQGKHAEQYYANYRMILVNKRLYEIVLVNREEFPSDKMTELFMDSFLPLK